MSAIPKVPGTSIISEHRPISVLPSLSKVAERCLLRQLRPYIFNPPNDNQFAYLNGRSVDDALATVQFYVSAGFAACPNSTKVAVISLDISKAFDQVPKNSLVKSLKEKEVPGAFLRLLDSYLSDRQQTVRIGVTDSKPATVGSGVAQGSILGPNLFIFYISEILAMNLSRNTRLVAYADDLLLIKPIVSDDDCTQLQQDLDTILEAYSRLFLSINPSKSSLLLCTLAEPHMAQVLPCEFVLEGTPVSRVPELKYLGVTLDHKLNFSRNAQLSSAKAKKAIGALWRTIGRWSGRETFKRIFTSKVLPILTHGLPMVAPSTLSGWNCYEKTLRYAARLAMNDYQSSYTQLLESLRWKNFSRICIERQLLLVYKWRANIRFIPPFILAESEQRRPLRNRNRNPSQLQIRRDIFTANNPRMRSGTSQNPLSLAIENWNNLPHGLSDLDLEAFTREIRKFQCYAHLQTEAFSGYRARPSALMSASYTVL